MTTPNNQPPVPAIPFAVTGSGATGDGSGTSAADLVTRTQAAITALLKQTQIQDSPGWKSATASTYAGLTPGIPYSLAIVEQFVSQVTGLPIGSWATVNEALLALEGIASNQDLQNNWTTLLTDFGLSPTNAAGLATAILDAAEGNWKPLLALLFGSSTATGVTASIAAPAVADTVHTPQVVSNFSNAASIAGGGWASGGWSWDSGLSWQGSAGSAKVVADGSLKAMGGVMVPVQPGQTVAVGQTSSDGSVITTAPVVWWVALAAASGIPMQFQLVPYSGPDGARVAGTPFVVAQSASLAVNQSAWQPLSLVTDATNHVAAGVYTVPSSGVTAVQARLVVDSVASAGSVWWNNCQLVIAGGYLPTMQAGFQRLQDDAAAANAATQTFLNAIKTANTADAGNIPQWLADVGDAYKVWAATESGIAQDELATVGDILQAALGFNPLAGLFPPTQVGGVGGLATIEDTLETWITQFSTSIGDALSIDITALENLPGVAQLLNALGITSAAAHTLSADTANIVGYVNNRPIMGGLDDTAEANMAYLSATTPIPLLAPTSCIAFIRCSQIDTKGAISFTAEQSSGTPPSGLHVNLFKVDFPNQQLVPLATTAFVTAQLTLATEAMLFADAGQTSVVAGDVLAVEWQSTDTTHGLTLFGQAVSKPNHPVAKLPAFGATRNAGTTAPTAPIPFSDLTWSNNNLPYAGLETTTPPAPIFFPQQHTKTADGTYTPAPWAVYADLVVIGNGGGGEGETGAGNGPGGLGGAWSLLTLTIGATGAAGLKAGTAITFTGIGNVGAGGAFFTPGSPGGNIVASWVDAASAPQSVTVPGGLGGNVLTNATSWGLAPVPQSETFEGFFYPAGSTNVVGGVGNSPGAGGTGGAAFQFGFAGASGRAWVVDRQT